MQGVVSSLDEGPADCKQTIMRQMLPMQPLGVRYREPWPHTAYQIKKSTGRQRRFYSKKTACAPGGLTEQRRTVTLSRLHRRVASTFQDHCQITSCTPHGCLVSDIWRFVRRSQDRSSSCTQRGCPEETPDPHRPPCAFYCRLRTVHMLEVLHRQRR